MAPPLDAHLVSHTHWDREWYHPVERFRQRLVALVDELLDDPPAANESFLLDGQAIVIADYLDVRPEHAAEVGAMLRDGRLEAGPWFVLADELIPSGEALVRNLFAGRRELSRLRATSPPVLYCPDSFGHPAALPAIAAGFGLPTVIAWRGYGGPHWPSGDTVRWRASNGDSVLLYHLPRSGYEFGSHLPVDVDAARERWERMRAELAPRATTGVTLVPHGADHHARQAGFREAIASLELAGTDDGVHRSSLRRFAAALVDRSALAELPVVTGELRDSSGYTWSLQGTLATRAHEKRGNARAERLLVREAEPWSALASRDGTSRRAVVHVAWRTLLEAHPHDTLCGCSIDQVAAAMELRVRSAANQAEGIRDDAIATLIGHDPAVARESREAWTPAILIRNPAARVRSGVAIADVDEWLADVPVGPGSGGSADDVRESPRRRPRVPALGRIQVLANAREYSLIESPRHYPDNDLIRRTRVAAWVSDAPAYGIASYPIGLESTAGVIPSGSEGIAIRPRQFPDNPVTTGPRSLQNGLISVSVSERGEVAIEDAASGRRIPSVVELVDEDDFGDLYTPSPRTRAFSVECLRARRVHRGPLRGELAVVYRITDGSTRRARAEIELRLILDANSPVLRIQVDGNNVARDHRVRLALRTDVVDGETWADAAFGPVRRLPVVADAESATIETPPPTAALHRYVSVFNSALGATVISDGLAEYESRDDGSILVTLVRGVGQLSRNDVAERPGHAGWPKPTPGAQCLGAFQAELALMLHGPRDGSTIDDIERTSDDVLCPMTGTTLRSALGTPPTVHGVELIGPGLAMSAIKESEDGVWLVLRCVNLRDVPAVGEWRLPFEPTQGKIARLDETPMSDLEIAGRYVPIVASPRDVVTILVR